MQRQNRPERRTGQRPRQGLPDRASRPLQGGPERARSRLPRASGPAGTSTASERLDLRMSARGDTSPSIEQQLLEQPRRAAGIVARGGPVRLGELDSHCHLVGDIDQHGLAWESLTERIIAVHGHRLAEAIALPYNDPRRDHLMDEVLDVPEDSSPRWPKRRPGTSGSMGNEASSCRHPHPPQGASSGPGLRFSGWPVPGVSTRILDIPYKGFGLRSSRQCSPGLLPPSDRASGRGAKPSAHASPCREQSFKTVSC